MVRQLKRVRVKPGSELDRLLQEAAATPLLLERDGELYRLERERENIWKAYDPNAALEGIRAAAGSWKDIDAEALKAYIYRARKEGTRPSDRP